MDLLPTSYYSVSQRCIHLVSTKSISLRKIHILWPKLTSLHQDNLLRLQKLSKLKSVNATTLKIRIKSGNEFLICTQRDFFLVCVCSSKEAV